MVKYMGLFDAVEKIANTVNKVDRTMNTADRTVNTAKRAQGYVDKAGKFIEAKCKICKKNPLKTDIEKQKGVCVSCAMARM